MAIAEAHKGIVVGATVISAIIGALLGWFPGSDLIGLSILWGISFSLILTKSDLSKLKSPVIRVFMALIGAGFIIATGIEIASGLTLPLYLLINPLLNAFATYRLLRVASKLLASEDVEELSSNFFANILSVLGLIVGTSS